MTHIDPVIMGERIKKQRLLNGYSREKLAEMADQPEHYVIYALAGAAFALLGVVWGGLAIKKLATHDYKEMMDDDAEEMERALEDAEKEEEK